MKDEELNFIKRAVDDADGFGFLYGKAPFENMMATVICEGHQYIIREKTFKDIIYPFLIQSAIEGIEFNYAKLGISTTLRYIPKKQIWSCQVYRNSKRRNSAFSENTAIEAKEEALKHIYEQETNNGS